MLVDAERMTKVIGKLVDDPHARAELLGLCDKVTSAVKAHPPTTSAEEVTAALSEIAAFKMDWRKNEDVEVRRLLRRLATKIDRMRRLKSGGVGAYAGELGSSMQTLLDRLKRHGLFLVPVGELEEWLAAHSVGVSKSDKRAWSNVAAQRIQSLGKQQGDVWDFMLGVGQYLAGTLPGTGSGL